MKRFCVLVVDDEERILNFLSHKLKASGYNVLAAKNGTQGLEQAQAQEPDLVVLDVLMPGMDGFETLKQLRSFSSVPVIIFSVRESSTDRIKGLSLGADDYLPKPFDPDELVARIMPKEQVRRLPVVEDSCLVGMLSLGDVTTALQGNDSLVAETLCKISTPAQAVPPC
jgi:DNA-binding response OmpR family regulator